MPGFVINGTGGETVATGPNANVEVRRTHRWVFQTLGKANRDILLYLKSASRPSFAFEEPSMHHNQEQIYFAGKHTWEPITLTWYDVEQNPDVSQAVYEWLTTIIDIERMCVGRAGNAGGGDGYKSANATLAMVDGCGKITEEWTLYNGWPKSTNWGSLDYTSTELQTIEVVYRFDRAVKTKGNGVSR